MLQKYEFDPNGFCSSYMFRQQLNTRTTHKFPQLASWNQLLAFAQGLPLVLMLTLTAWSTWDLARSPRWGGRPGITGTIQSVEIGSPLHKAGINPGDSIVEIGGTPIPEWFWVEEPDLLNTWPRLDSFHLLQRRLDAAWNSQTISVKFHRYGQQTTAILEPARFGIVRSVRATLPLLACGWSFALLGFLLFRKRKDRVTTLTYLVGLATCATLATLAPFPAREIVVGGGNSDRLALANFLFAHLGTCLALNFALAFPCRLPPLVRHIWLARIPCLLATISVACHLARVPGSPNILPYLLPSLFVALFMAITLFRLASNTDPIAKPQLQWIALAFLCGLSPWLALSAIPVVMGGPRLPENVTMLFFVLAPIGVAFSITRYRLLEVGRILDWVTVHFALVVGLSALELAAWRWTIGLWPESRNLQQSLLALQIALLVLLYAPLRDLLLRGIARISGRLRPPFESTVKEFLTRTSSGIDPRGAVQGALASSLHPNEALWSSSIPDLPRVLFETLRFHHSGTLGIELPGCPPQMLAAAWIPVEGPLGVEALVLQPRQGKAWRRSDLETASVLIRTLEPVLRSQALQEEREIQEREHKEQREAVLREIHDGVGSRLFGLSLLASTRAGANPDSLVQKLSIIESEARQALGELRTGISILGAPPREFLPALLEMLGRHERFLSCAGIELISQIDSSIGSVRLSSTASISILRTLQEALTNVARHSKATTARISFGVTDDALEIALVDDGTGFSLDKIRLGNGLPGMAARLEALGGRVQLDSSPDRGTTIRIVAPREKEIIA